MDCGTLVNLNSVITVNMMNEDGTMTATEMSEANARALLAEVGLPPPPILCCQHDPEEIVTERI